MLTPQSPLVKRQKATLDGNNQTHASTTPEIAATTGASSTMASLLRVPPIPKIANEKGWITAVKWSSYSPTENGSIADTMSVHGWSVCHHRDQIVTVPKPGCFTEKMSTTFKSHRVARAADPMILLLLFRGKMDKFDS